jgi:hypothetical protein
MFQADMFLCGSLSRAAVYAQILPTNPSLTIPPSEGVDEGSRGGLSGLEWQVEQDGREPRENSHCR